MEPTEPRGVCVSYTVTAGTVVTVIVSRPRVGLVCGWCQTVLVVSHGPVSHGMCTRCVVRFEQS